MAKGKVARAETKDQVPAKTDGRSISAPEPAEYHRLAATHCVLTAPYQYVKDDQVRGPSVDGSVELYMGLQPKNALESILGSSSLMYPTQLTTVFLRRHEFRLQRYSTGM